MGGGQAAARLVGLAVAVDLAVKRGRARRHTTVRAPDTTIAALPADRVVVDMARVARLADLLLRLAARCVVVAGDAAELVIVAVVVFLAG